MNGGYTPVFNSVFTGTLCGQYPDTAAWLFLLALADRHGVVDVTPQYISSVTGMPVADLMSCIDRFMKPDPGSRTPDNDGRRLELLHPHRPWGWRILNHAIYRERARLASKNAREIASGENSSRMASRRPPVTAGDRRSPPLTTADPLSYSNINKDIREEDPSASSTPAKGGAVAVSRGTDPDWFLDFKLAYPPRSGDQGWRKAMRAANARMSEGHTVEEFVAGARRYAVFCESAGKAGTEYVKQAATFLGPDKPFLLPWHPPPKPENASQRILRTLDAKTNSRVIEHESDGQPLPVPR